jgi:hypothetical protein
MHVEGDREHRTALLDSLMVVMMKGEPQAQEAEARIWGKSDCGFNSARHAQIFSGFHHTIRKFTRRVYHHATTFHNHELKYAFPLICAQMMSNT